MEIQAKDTVSTLLDNPILRGLIWDKKYVANADTFIELESELTFTIKPDGERLVIVLHDILPKITTKVLRHMITLNGRLQSISIGKNDIILGISGLPSQTIHLT